MKHFRLRDVTAAAEQPAPLEVSLAVLDGEVAAIHQVVKALEPLDADRRDRVLAYINSRFAGAGEHGWIARRA